MALVVRRTSPDRRRCLRPTGGISEMPGEYANANGGGGGHGEELHTEARRYGGTTGTMTGSRAGCLPGFIASCASVPPVSSCALLRWASPCISAAGERGLDTCRPPALDSDLDSDSEAI